VYVPKDSRALLGKAIINSAIIISPPTVHPIVAQSIVAISGSMIIIINQISRKLHQKIEDGSAIVGVH
jgi:hypothetical protein